MIPAKNTICLGYHVSSQCYPNSIILLILVCIIKRRCIIRSCKLNVISISCEKNIHIWWHYNNKMKIIILVFGTSEYDVLFMCIAHEHRHIHIFIGLLALHLPSWCNIFRLQIYLWLPPPNSLVGHPQKLYQRRMKLIYVVFSVTDCPRRPKHGFWPSPFFVTIEVANNEASNLFCMCFQFCGFIEHCLEK